MPIVTLTEDNKTTYYAVTEGDECRVDAVVTEYKLAASNKREYAEHALRTEYLRRLTEHAHECAQLAHLVLNPPDDDDLLSNLKTSDRLAAKIAKDAVWLRTYDPFTGLTSEVVANAKDDGSEGRGTCLEINCRSGFEHDEDDVRHVSSLDGDSWDATDRALWARDPWRRDHFARAEQEKSEREAERQNTPAGQKRIDKAAKDFVAAVDYATKLKKRSAKTVANKTARRTKTKRTKRAS